MREEQEASLQEAGNEQEIKLLGGNDHFGILEIALELSYVGCSVQKACGLTWPQEVLEAIFLGRY